MELLEAVNQFYYAMSLHELRLMSGKDALGGLSYNSMLYLNVISMTPECTVSKIAETLHVTKPAVTLKVNELERQGALCKTQSERDKRVFFLTLTGEAARAFLLYDKNFIYMEERLREKFTPEQLELFCGMLRTMGSCDWKGLDFS